LGQGGRVKAQGALDNAAIAAGISLDAADCDVAPDRMATGSASRMGFSSAD